MSHVRKQIRDAAVAALASLGGVHATRTVPVDQAELPVILVYTNSEQIERMAVGLYARTLELVVEIVAKGRAVDDELDGLLVSVEPLLNANRLGGLCRPLVLNSISVDVDASGETPIGRARVTYSAVYQTAHADTETSV
jgi:hypothetical protein